MQEELQRIKKKDYSQIDQQLFSNMLRTDNLTSTLSHLSQFQQFLMQQINSLNQNDANPATASLHKSITKNFDTLRQSLVHCSRIVSQNQVQANTASLKKKINDLQEELKRTKVQVKKEMQSQCKSVKQNAQTTCRYLLSSYEKQRILRKKAEEKYNKLLQQNQMLKKQSRQTRQKQKDLKTSQLLIQVQPSNQTLNLSEQTSKYLPKSKPSQQLVQPLKDRMSYNGLCSVPSFSEKQWKIAPIERQNRFCSVKEDSVSKRTSLSRQSSSHRLTNKQNLALLKQNQALLSKGVKQERRKSKQKIKIFSML